MLRHTFIHLPGKVTTIGALGGGKLALFVQGVNLDQFPGYIAQFPLLVTFNGSQFDVPFLRMHFPQARLDHAHIDLRFVFHTLGYRPLGSHCHCGPGTKHVRT